MKKLYYIFAACMVVMAFSACSLKEDDTFEEQASQRSEANIENVQKVLVSAPNGWLMEYYGALGFGGYNVMVKFDGTNATFGSEKWGANHKAGLDADGKCITSTSHFKIEQSMGTVLSFDDYNETFHYYSMPNNPDYNYDKDEGLYGDFEFRVMKASNDSIILRGKKHNNRIVMTPIPADKSWESIINDAKETEDYMMSRSYTLAGPGYQSETEVTATSNGGYRCFIFTYKDETDQKVTVSAPYIVKQDGFYFYSPVTVNGFELDGLVRGETGDYFKFRNNENLQLNCYVPPLAESLVTGTWYMTYDKVGSLAKPYWDAMLAKLKTAGKNKDEIKIYTSTFGLTSDGKMAASMTTSTDAPYWGYSYNANEAGDEITFANKSSVKNKAGQDYYNKYGWKDILGTIYGHTFKLSCDNQRQPKYIELRDVKDGNNVLVLLSTPTYFMDSSYYQDK